ncbi:MAG: twin transmembrane helix small protein [Xanthomonadaceae bacterium]|nr:twin transmembrane helix small protein [Xanthomonadaceae bacterium]
MSDDSMELLPKLFVILMLLGIVGSLGSGLFYLVRDRDSTDRTARALTIRILLSVFLFGMLMLGIFTGVIEPHGVNPNIR